MDVHQMQPTMLYGKKPLGKILTLPGTASSAINIIIFSSLFDFFDFFLFTSLVPVIAFGFDDLRERANAQSTQSSSHLQKLTDLSNRLKSLLTEHSISNASRLQRAHNAQTQLIQRLMRLVQHLHLLIPAVRSSSIRVEEEELRGKLEEMEEELKRSRVKGKLNEMWALLGAVGAFMERGRGDGQGGQGEWAVVDDEGLAQITQVRFFKKDFFFDSITIVNLCSFLFLFLHRSWQNNKQVCNT